MSTIRHLITGFALLAAVAAVATAEEKKAEEKKKDGPHQAVLVKNSAVRQAQLKRSFEQFRTKLGVLANRLEASSDPKDQEKAKAMRAALKEAQERATEMKFESIIRALNTRGADQNLDVLGQAVRENKELRDDLQKLLDLIRRDDRDKVLKERREEALRLLATLKELRDRQARAQSQTELGRKSDKELGKDQKKITGDTKGLRDKLDKPSADTEIAKQMEAVKKPVGEANKEQKSAEGQLGKGDKDSAGESQGRAVAKLNEAIKEIEDLINQTRQEEKERKLKDLLARAKKMLQVEKDVLAGSESLSRDLAKLKGGKPEVTHATRSNKLSEAQLDNLRECEGALNLIREEGTAVAFQEIFEQISKDMDTAQRRLSKVEVDAITLVIEGDVVTALEEVVRALDKAIKDNQQPPSPPSPPAPAASRTTSWSACCSS